MRRTRILKIPLFQLHAVDDPDAAIEAKARAREWAWDRAEDVRRYAIIVQDYLAFGDDRGVGYAIAKLTINLQHVVEIMREIDPRISA
jgi:hypothetical protein